MKLKILIDESIITTEFFSITIGILTAQSFLLCIYNHRTTKTNQKYPSVNL